MVYATVKAVELCGHCSADITNEKRNMEVKKTLVINTKKCTRCNAINRVYNDCWPEG